MNNAQASLIPWAIGQGSTDAPSVHQSGDTRWNNVSKKPACLIINIAHANANANAANNASADAAAVAAANAAADA